MQSDTILIKNVSILPQDQNDKVKLVDILIENSLITSITDTYSSQTVRISSGAGSCMIIDGTGKLAMPGLVNSHTHSGMSLLRNYADDLPLEKWLFDKIFPIEDKLTDEDVYWASLLSMIEMIKGGTTCFADMYFFMDRVAQAVDEVGMRAALSRGVQCFDFDFDKKSDIRLLESRRLCNDWNGKANGRIRVDIAPHSVYTCIPPYLKACIDLAKELNTGIHIHLLETATEAANSQKNFGTSAVEHCDSYGMFELPVMSAHSVHLTAEDRHIFADNAVNVLHCPGSNLKLGSGVANIPAMMRLGINICLGTDSAASNNDLDMFEEMRLAATIHKGAHMDAELINASQALQMATVNGAVALGFGENVGILAQGYKADIILIDIDKPHYYPQHNLQSAMVYSSKSSDVDTVIVDGKVLMKNRELLTIDEEKVKSKIIEISKKIFK